MICPRWVYTRIQPIAIRNVLEYLVGALDEQASAGRIIEIGGLDVLTYREMMMRYARLRRLRRLLVPVPLLTPRLSSYWVHLVTPVQTAIARPLIDGLRNEVVVRDDSARRLFSRVHLLGYDEAVAAALARLETGAVDSSWTDALSTSLGQVPPVIFTEQEGLLIERRRRLVAAEPARLFRAFTALGGKTGWLFLNWTWRVRGGLDRLAGGVGLRRGRRHPTEVRVGDALDFWRVEAVEPNHLLRLRAEMKVPGRAWLQFEVQEHGPGRSLVSQTAYFAPQGLAGLLYWYALYPVHALIFSGMIRRLAERAEAESGDTAAAARGARAR